MTLRTAFAFAVLAVVACTSPVLAQSQCPFTAQGSMVAADPDMSPRLFRDEPPSACAAPTTCATSAGTFNFDAYPMMTTPGPMQACVTVTITPGAACTGTAFLHSGAYLGTFNPTGGCAGWIADIGNSPDPTTAPSKSYSFNVAPATLFTVVVNESFAGGLCPQYQIDITGCNVTPVGILDFSVNTP